MKVVFVIQKLAGLVGGAERVITQAASAMSQRGHEVMIVTFEARTGVPAYPAEGVRIRNLFPFFGKQNPNAAPNLESAPPEHRPHRIEAMVKALPNVFPIAALKWRATHGLFEHRLRALIRQERPDVMIGFLRPAITAAAFAARGTGVRVIASVHNVPGQDYGNASRWDQNPIHARRSQDAFDLVSDIVVLLAEFKTWFAPGLQQKIHVIPNPIAPAEAPPRPATRREPVVLAVGRLARIKRFDLLIRAWSLVGPRYPPWKLKIFGIGAEQGSLQRLIQSLGIGGQTLLAGATRNIGNEYDRASILCHPSEFEGFGLAVAEAMAHGLPVVGFADCPGVNTLVEPPKNGILLAAGDGAAERLAVALEELILSPETRDEMGACGVEISKRYAPEIIYGAWEKLITG